MVHGLEDLGDERRVVARLGQHGLELAEVDEALVRRVDGAERGAELAERVAVAAVGDDHEGDAPQAVRGRVRLEVVDHVLVRERLHRPQRLGVRRGLVVARAALEPRVLEHLLHVRPLVHLGLEQVLDEGLGVLGPFRHRPPRHVVALALQIPQQRVLVVEAREGHGARQQHVGDDAQGPDVALGVVGAPDDLGRHTVNRPDELVQLLLPRVVRLRETEVDDHDLGLGRLGHEEHVLELEVAVDDVEAVHVRDRVAHLRDVAARVALAVGRALVEVAAAAEGDDEVELALLGVELQRPHDVRVVEAHHDVDLVEHLVDHVLREALGLERLDGVPLLRLLVLGAGHRADGPPADGRLDVVVLADVLLALAHDVRAGRLAVRHDARIVPDLAARAVAARVPHGAVAAAAPAQH